jgi:hypothetical protein
MCKCYHPFNSSIVQNKKMAGVMQGGGAFPDFEMLKIVARGQLKLLLESVSIHITTTFAGPVCLMHPACLEIMNFFGATPPFSEREIRA